MNCLYQSLYQSQETGDVIRCINQQILCYITACDREQHMLNAAEHDRSALCRNQHSGVRLEVKYRECRAMDISGIQAVDQMTASVPKSARIHINAPR